MSDPAAPSLHDFIISQSLAHSKTGPGAERSRCLCTEGGGGASLLLNSSCRCLFSFTQRDCPDQAASCRVLIGPAADTYSAADVRAAVRRVRDRFTGQSSDNWENTRLNDGTEPELRDEPRSTRRNRITRNKVFSSV